MSKMVASNELKIDNIYLPYNYLFTKEAKKVFRNKVYNTINSHKLENGEIVLCPVQYLGSACTGEEDILKAAIKVSDKINELAAKGFLFGVLLELGLFELYKSSPLDPQKYLVLCYVAVTPEGDEYLKEMKPPQFEMGGIPDNVSDESDSLEAEGEALDRIGKLLNIKRKGWWIFKQSDVKYRKVLVDLHQNFKKVEWDL